MQRKRVANSGGAQNAPPRGRSDVRARAMPGHVPRHGPADAAMQGPMVGCPGMRMMADVDGQGARGMRGGYGTSNPDERRGGPAHRHDAPMR